MSDGDNGDLIGVGNAGASADACDHGGGVGMMVAVILVLIVKAVS